MKKYTILIKETEGYYYHIEADSEEEAKKEAERLRHCGEDPDQFKSLEQEIEVV